MQCFTRVNKYPRTSLRVDYVPPEPKHYRKREPFRPEPSRITRPWCPDGIPVPDTKRVMCKPGMFDKREERTDEILEFINKTNWMCSGEIQAWGGRKSKISDSVKYSLQSTTRATYPGHAFGREPRRHPNVYPAIGITPAAYATIPYGPARKHPYTRRSYSPEHPYPGDLHTRCEVTSVPHYIPDPYPAPAPSRVYKPPIKETVTKMGWVP